MLCIQTCLAVGIAAYSLSGRSVHTAFRGNSGTRVVVRDNSSADLLCNLLPAVSGVPEIGVVSDACDLSFKIVRGTSI